MHLYGINGCFFFRPKRVWRENSVRRTFRCVRGGYLRGQGTQDAGTAILGQVDASPTIDNYDRSGAEEDMAKSPAIDKIFTSYNAA